MISLSEALKTKSSLESCTAIFFVRGQKILIGLRHYPDWLVWTTPGGMCQEGETLEQGLRREVFEEIGIDAMNICEYLGMVPAVKKAVQVHVFICESDQEPVLCEVDKFSEWRWQDIDEIPENFINPGALELVKIYLQ